MNDIFEYYDNYDEDGRLLTKHGLPEFIITMDYVHKYLKPGDRILEIGAATGRYSIALADEGYDVTSVDLIPQHLDILTDKITPDHNISVYLGNAVSLKSLSRFCGKKEAVSLNDNEFDMVLILGPLYHIKKEADRLKAIKEAKRVCKPGGIIISAFCMLDPSIFRAFHNEKIIEYMNEGLILDNFDVPKDSPDIFSLTRPDDVKAFMNKAGLEYITQVGVDSIANIFNKDFDNLSDEVFELYIQYLRSVCERQDMIGLSMHIIDIRRKI